MMKTKKELIKELIDLLEQLHNSTDRKRSEWTHLFKQGISDLGKDNGFKVYSSEEGGEFLFDIVWSEEGEDWRKTFQGLKLICEIEWNRNLDDILFDFQKLTIVESDIRLFIFSYGDEKDYFKEEVINTIKESLQGLKIKEKEFLVVGIGDKSNSPSVTKISI